MPWPATSPERLRSLGSALKERRRRSEARHLGASLIDFVRAAWRVVEPGRAYQHNWHIEAIAEHLEAVTRGDIRRLGINVPFPTMKSTLGGGMWPARTRTFRPPSQWLTLRTAADL